MIKAAMAQEEYLIRNGNNESRRGNSLLTGSKYIIRAISKNFTNKKVLQSLIYRRLKNIASEFGYIKLSVKNIVKSVELRIAKDLYIRDRELTNEHFDLIGDTFNLKKRMINGKPSYDYSLMSHYINVDNLKELYPDEIL